jgi:hypothetical protein
MVIGRTTEYHATELPSAFMSAPPLSRACYKWRLDRLPPALARWSPDRAAHGRDFLYPQRAAAPPNGSSSGLLASGSDSPACGRSSSQSSPRKCSKSMMRRHGRLFVNLALPISGSRSSAWLRLQNQAFACQSRSSLRLFTVAPLYKHLRARNGTRKETIAMASDLFALVVLAIYAIRAVMTA